MRNRKRSANPSADEKTLASAGQAAHQHAAAGAHADFGEVFSVNAVTLELAFGIHVSSVVVQTGDYHDRVERVAFAIGQDDCLGKNANGRLARDAARFIDLGDA